MLEQLLKKNKLGEYENMYPVTLLEAIKLNGNSNESLKDFIKSINHIYVKWKGDISTTLNSISPEYRRKGLWVTFVDCKGKVNTYYYNNGSMSDSNWGDIENWVECMSGGNFTESVIEIISWWYENKQNGG